jgi:glutathione-regulated potassium-efflux system ancillary protein KefC
VIERPLLVVGLVLGFLALKALVLWAMARAIPIPLAERPVFVILLAQGGEFGFVVFQAAAQAGAIDAAASSLLVAVVALSMLLTPLLLVVADRWWVPRLAAAQRTSLPEIAEPQDAPILICGFGRYGQIVGRLLFANGLQATVLDHDAEQVETVRRFGWPVFYGDATRLDLLRTAGAARARVIVVAIDDVEQSLKVVDLARQHFGQARIVARARNVTHYYDLRGRGVEHIERETLDAALMSGRSVLELMGWQPHAARTQALRFRRHSVDLLEQMAPHFKDEARLIAISKRGRQQLEELWARERADAKAGRREGWYGAADAESPGAETVTASDPPPPPPTPDR